MFGKEGHLVTLTGREGEHENEKIQRDLKGEAAKLDLLSEGF